MVVEYMLVAINKSLKWITVKQVFPCKAQSLQPKLQGQVIRWCYFSRGREIIFKNQMVN